MPEKSLYEYAVIRIVPRVEREEFINVGIIMFSKYPRFIRMRYQLDTSRLLAFAPKLDMEMAQRVLKAMDKVCSGQQEGGVIATLDISERFRWLTAVRSACVQTSRPHPGLTADLQHTFDSLYEEQVL